MSLILASVVLGAIVLWFAMNLPSPPKLFGVYAQPGPYQFFKEIIFAGLMNYRKKQVSLIKLASCTKNTVTYRKDNSLIPF